MAIDIRINGVANMGQVSKELAKVQAQTARLSSQINASNASLAGGKNGLQDQISAYRGWNTAMGQVRDDLIDITRAQGDFETSSMKVGNRMDMLTERLQKQQMGFREAKREIKALGDVYRHQLALQQATAVSWGKTAAGSTHVDLFTPNLNKQMAGIDIARKKMGFYGEVLSSVSRQTVNWGKNTQWGGRQLMAGLTYPLAIAAGVMGKTAYDIDKGLTQIVKVYGDASSQISLTDSQIRKSALNTAKNMTQFGQSATDTLEIQSQLASTGKTGQELQKDTELVSKARLLGELDIQDAMKATITLQQVYRMDTERLGDAFNYMNQMENETSLTMQDFVEGIPKISGIMQTLGADFEDTGILLAAMKTAGIDAKEGGNAIKSMVFKDIAPSAKAAKVFMESTGQSLQSITEGTKGDPVTTLQEIGEAIKGLNQNKKIEIFKEVFGIHQGSKAIGMVESLTESTGQMTKAFEIAQMSASEWEATADAELNALREAGWVKFQKVVEDAKIALAEAGQVILTEVTPFLEWLVGGLEKASKWFTSLSDGSKKALVGLLAIVGVAGPLIMLTGLFANLGGQAMAMASGIMKAVGSMDLQTTKQRVAQLTTQRSTQTVNDLTAANARLASSMDVLSMKAAMQKDPLLTSRVAAGVAPGAASAYSAKTSGMNMVPAPLKAAADHTNKISQNAEKTRRSWSEISNKMSYSVAAVGMFGTMATESGTAMNNMSQMAVAAGMIAPMFVGPKAVGALAKFSENLKTKMISGVTSGWAAFDVRAKRSIGKFRTQFSKATATGAVGSAAGQGVAGAAGGAAGAAGAGAAAKGVGRMVALRGALAAASAPLAAVSVLLGGFFYVVNKRIKEANEAQDAFNNSLETTGELLGYNTSEVEAAKKMDDYDPAQKYISLAKQLKEANGQQAKHIENMDSIEKTERRAIQMGIQHGQRGMMTMGWSRKEAMESARTYAVAINEEVAHNIEREITIDPFVTVGKVRINQINKISRSTKQALEKDFINDAIGDSWFHNTGMREDGSYKHPAVERSKLTDKGKKEIAVNAKAAYDAFKHTDGAARRKAFQDMGTAMYSGVEDVWGDFSNKQKKVLEEEGVVDHQTLAKYAEENGPQAVVDLLAENDAAMSEKHARKMGEAFQVLNDYIIQLLMEARGKTRKEIEAIYGDQLFDPDILLKTKGFGRAGQGIIDSLEARSKAHRQYKKDIELARQARSALTAEEQKAAKLAYIEEYGAKEGKLKYQLEVDAGSGENGQAKTLIDSIWGVGKASDSARKSTKKLTEEEELNRLNQRRRAAGLKETQNLQDGMKVAVTKSARQLAIEGKEADDNSNKWKKNTEAKKENWRAVQNIMAGGADGAGTFRITSDMDKEEVKEAAGSVKEIWNNVQNEIFEGMSQDLEDHHQGNMDKIEKDGEARANRLDAQEEKRNAEFDKRQEAIDAAFDAKEERFESRWDRTMEKFEAKWDAKNEQFESRWDKTMENFDTQWDNKSDRFEAKWDKTMENFEKKSERAKEAVERQYDARIKKIDDAIEAEQKAEQARQRIFEKEKARIQHLADMANRSIDINMAINTGDLDEAARLSNDAQASIDSFEIGDAGEESQSWSDKKISGLEDRKERLGTQKDAAIKRIEARMEAERKSLEEQRKIAQKSFEVARERERKILEAQRTREQKALESARNHENKRLEAQRTREQKSLENQRKATNARLERERETYAKEIKAARDANTRTTEAKKTAEQSKYEAAKRAMEKEMDALRAFVPRNEWELRKHIRKVEGSYGEYGKGLKKKGSEWGEHIGDSLQYQTRVARNAMESDAAWEKLGNAVANRITKGSFDMSLPAFMKWIGKGAPAQKSSSWSGSTGTGSGTGSSWKGKNKGKPKGVDVGTWKSRHAGGVIDGSKGSRVGYSGKNQSQSEVTINALKGESVLNRRATSALGKSGVDALNKGRIPIGHDTKRVSSAVRDDAVNQRGDYTKGLGAGISGVVGAISAGMAAAAMRVGIEEKGEEQQAQDAMLEGNWSAYGAGAGVYGGRSLGVGELKNAAIIASVGRSLGASPRDIQIALITALVESGLRNVPFGDRDSLGLFQQRAAWGSTAARMDPRKSARMFFLGGAQGQQGLLDKKNRSGRSMGELAQAVQVSAFPARYATQIPIAKAIYEAFKWKGSNASVPTGGVGAKSTGNVWPGMGWQKMWAIIHKRFPNRGFPSPGQINQGGHSRNSYHYKNRAIDLGSAKANGTPMNTLYDWLLSTYGSQSTQIIYGPRASSNILNGKRFNYGAATNAAHMGHIHWAMKNGGTVPGSGSGDKTHIMGEPGEFMLRKKAVDNVGVDFLRMLNSDRFVNMPKTAVGAPERRVETGNIDRSYSPMYNIKVDARGSSATASDIGREVKKALTEIERREGFDRRIGSK